MANTYTQTYIHIIFAVKHREALITRFVKDDIEKYITGVIKNQGHTLIAINSRPDHIHILIGMRPDVALSNLVRDIKRDSTNFMNSKNTSNGRFRWQEGLGAFTYSRSQLDRVAKYIQNQEKHHQRQNFRDEYELFLKIYGVQYDQRYTFDVFDLPPG